MAKLFTLKNVILFVAAWWLWKNVVSDWIDINWNLPFFGAGTIENYGDPHLHYSCWSGHGMHDCEPNYTAGEQCVQAAHAQCGTTDEELNKCWLPAFRKCNVSSALAGLDTDCHEYADSFCGGGPGGCSECFSGAHKQCMAANGLAKKCN